MPRKKSLDAQAAEFASIARSIAKIQKISVAAAFANITRDIAQPKPRLWKPMLPLDAAGASPYDPMGLWADPPSADEKRHARERALRFDLEAALLRLDACCPLPLGSTVTYPSGDELETLKRLVNETTRLIGKVAPPLGWPRWQKVDRHFPKLGLCKRVTGLVTRIAGTVPPRALTVLMRPVGAPGDALTKEFFATLLDTRTGKCDAASVDWRDFAPVLLRYQNAERQKTGKVPLPIFQPRPRSPTGSPAIEAYVAFLELDRTDLQWSLYHGQELSTVKNWIRTLNNEALWRKMEPFCAGTVNEMESGIARFKAMKTAWKRAQAAARQEKRREAKKKLGQKA